MSDGINKHEGERVNEVKKRCTLEANGSRKTRPQPPQYGLIYRQRVCAGKKEEKEEIE